MKKLLFGTMLLALVIVVPKRARGGGVRLFCKYH